MLVMVLVKQMMFDFATDASIPVQPDCGMNEEQRQKLRRLEVALIEYRESLEERGISYEEIENKVANHRKRLESEYRLADPNENVSGNKRRDRRDDIRDSRKQHRSQSQSKSPPPQKSSNRDRGRENNLDRNGERHRDRDRAHDLGE